MLHDSQVDALSGTKQAFDADGYICDPALFDRPKIDEINAEIDRFIRNVAPTMPTSQVYYEDRNDRSTLKQLQYMYKYDTYFAELMERSRVRELAETVLGEAVRPVNMQFFNKPAGVGQPTPPHQDGYFFHLTPCRAVTGWLALEDVDEENGCIHYVRGSHKAPGFRPHDFTGVLGFSQGIVNFGDETEDTQNAVSFPGGPGTFLIHDAKTIHWAGPNNSPSRSRRALGFIYYAESAQVDEAAQRAYQDALNERLRASSKI